MFSFFSISLSASFPEPAFQLQTIDDDVGIGYGLQVADMNSDGKADIVLVDKDNVSWYENPSWKKHLLIGKLTKRDHVCVTARDLDGDGVAEVAVGGEWNPNDTLSSGAVFYLSSPSEGSDKWSAATLRHEPTTHRMHWVKGFDGSFDLIVKPLHGRGNQKNQGRALKVIAYQKQKNKEKDQWKETVVCEFLHNSHNFHPLNWDQDEEEEILITGLEGTWLLDRKGHSWHKKMISKSFGGEVRDGFDSGRKRFITTIEPRHGSVVAVYSKEGERWMRTILDTTLRDGHALATGDFLDVGHDQVVAGWRAMRPSGAPGIRIYVKVSKEMRDWKSFQISKDEVAVEDLKVADLNKDGRLDIIAAGRQTHNLVIFWNQTVKEK